MACTKFSKAGGFSMSTKDEFSKSAENVKRVRFLVGSYYSGYDEVTVSKTLCGATVRHKLFGGSHDEKDEKIRLTQPQWDDFVTRLFALGITSWSKDYSLIMPDGTEWGLYVYFTDGKPIKIYGLMAFPPKWGGLVSLFAGLGEQFGGSILSAYMSGRSGILVHGFNYSDAYGIAQTYHEGQVDKAGKPYIDHLQRVADILKQQGYDETVQCIGLLHDTIECTKMSVGDMIDLCVPEHIVHTVLLLSKNIGDTSGSRYYARIKNDADALAVKLADIKDNMDEDRLAKLKAATREKLVKKYTHAQKVLTGK
jgi:hypothetical protein